MAPPAGANAGRGRRNSAPVSGNGRRAGEQQVSCRSPLGRARGPDAASSLDLRQATLRPFALRCGDEHPQLAGAPAFDLLANWTAPVMRSRTKTCVFPSVSNPKFVAFETNATSELNYVYRNSGRVGRVTVFRSTISDMLRPGGVVVAADAWAQGAEVEWAQELGSKLKIGSNISYAETFDPRVPNGGGQNRVSPKYLGNATALYRVTPNLILGGRLYYVGDRLAGKGYKTTDITISRQDLFFPGFGIRAGVKNGFDSDVTYLTARPNGTTGTSTWPKRSAWVQVSWKE